jgi:hypothetical protein
MIVFLSSTCYDLADLRAEVEKFLTAKGHAILLSDRANFPISPGSHRHDVCLENVSKCDLFVVVLDRRYGAPYYKDLSISITWAELREALRTKKHIVAFVRQDIFNERLSFKHNKKLGNSFDPVFVDNLKTFDLIDEVQLASEGIWLQPFDNSVQIKEKLENLYETKHSPLNRNDLGELQVYKDEFFLSEVSHSASSFLIKYHNLTSNEKLSCELLERAIASIPEQKEVQAKSSDFSPDEFFYFQHLKENENTAEKLMQVSTTALGRSVKAELTEILKTQRRAKKERAAFIDTVKRKPLICCSCEFVDHSYIIGVYTRDTEFGTISHSVCALRLFANKWQIVFNKPIDDGDGYFDLSDQMEFCTGGNDLYFCFDRIIQRMGNMNNGFGEVEFLIFDFQKLCLSKLVYSGIYRGQKSIDGEFDFSFLNSNSEAGAYRYILESRAEKSKWIYRTPDDYDLDSPDNCIEKWEIDNPDFYYLSSGKIYFHYYDQNIFWGSDYYGDISTFKERTDHIENDEYLICYWLAGPILAKRKSVEKYFVVWVSQGHGAGGSWGMRAIKNVSFISEHSFQASTGYESYEIDLIALTYTRQSI